MTIERKPVDADKAVVRDLSPVAISLARVIDRLPPGVYRITLTKQRDKPKICNMHIEEVREVRKL